ncbi:MAG: hypothetical protein ACQEW9_04195 [Bacteroidota bacterium]
MQKTHIIRQQTITVEYYRLSPDLSLPTFPTLTQRFTSSEINFINSFT